MYFLFADGAYCPGFEPHVKAVIMKNVSAVTWQPNNFILGVVINQADAARAVRLDN